MFSEARFVFFDNLYSIWHKDLESSASATSLELASEGERACESPTPGMKDLEGQESCFPQVARREAEEVYCRGRGTVLDLHAPRGSKFCNVKKGCWTSSVDTRLGDLKKGLQMSVTDVYLT